MEFFILWLIIGLLAWWVGSRRTIWFGWAFIVSLLLGPIGWLIIIFSRPVYLTQNYNGNYKPQAYKIQTIEIERESPESIKKSEEFELENLKKEKLSNLLNDWEEWKITEEQYKMKKERIMLM